MRQLLESTIPMQVSKIMTGRTYGWSDKCTEANIAVLFQGMALYLGRNKSKDTPLAVELRDFNGNFHFGAHVEYIKQGEEASDEGSWALAYTFYEDEIDHDNWNVTNFTENQVSNEIAKDIAYNHFGFIYKFESKDDNGKACEGSAQELLCTIIDVVKDYMQANMTEDNELNFEGYFTMTAKPDSDGKAYIGIVPSAQLKQLVKDDASIKENGAAA